MNETQGWCIKSSTRGLELWSLRKYEADAKHVASRTFKQEWERLEKIGYRCVRVAVSEI